MHFDYPYYAEDFDGLHDEILGDIWTRSSKAILVGSQIPADEIVSGTPKFGYRCLQTALGHSISCNSSAFSLKAADSYEFIFWMRITSSYSGDIVTLSPSDGSACFRIVLADMHLGLQIPGLSFSLQSTNTFALNQWTQCAVRLTPNEASLIFNGTTTSQAISHGDISAAKCSLGGFAGQIDEFIFKSSVSDKLPTEPVQARLNLTDLGGFGTGSAGNTVITSNCVLNTYASAAFENSSTLRASFSIQGKFGDFSPNTEIMIVDLNNGSYCFRKILSITRGSKTNSIRLFTPVDDFKNYYAPQIISVPNFNTLTINSGVTVSPLKWTGTAGGIVVFRAKNGCTINGSIITSGFGQDRGDGVQLTHGKLIDSFIPNAGGGIYIICGGTFSAGASARLGATWSGALLGGTAKSKSAGGPGGAGYGGAGGSDSDNGGLGGNGGVGGGGGGGDGAHAGDAGKPGQSGAQKAKAGTGGGAATHSSTSKISDGGIQGSIYVNSSDGYSASGGGGAGGNAGKVTHHNAITPSGANLVLIAETLKVDEAAISTGGAGGSYGYTVSGGGGTGFCYIACKNFA